MSYRPKKAVLDGISVRRRVRNGVQQTIYDAYLGYDPFDRKQKRLQATSLEELKAKIHKFYVAHQSGGDAAVRLRPNEAVDARSALDVLEQANSQSRSRKPSGGSYAAKTAEWSANAP